MPDQCQEIHQKPGLFSYAEKDYLNNLVYKTPGKVPHGCSMVTRRTASGVKGR